MKRLLILNIFVLIFSLTSAQYVSEFSQDTTLYIEELSSMFGSSLMDEELLVFENFQNTWDSIGYSYRVQIMELSELLRLRSSRARPQYVMFLRIIEEFHRENKIGYGYDAWYSAYHRFLSNPNTLLKDINKMNLSTYNMLKESLLYHSVTLDWRFESTSFRFEDIDGLKVVTDNNVLIAKAGNDSIMIHQVAGYLDPVNQVFKVEKGNVYWERAGFRRENVYAKLSPFTINLKQPGYKAEDVVFTHKELLDKPADGRIEDRISQIKTSDVAKYPQFFSYQGTYELDDIVPGVNFRGGLSMQGANLAGTEKEGKNALMEFYNNDTLRMRVNSRLFLFNSDMIRSNNAEISIYIESDSIYHPDLILNYNINSELLRLTKSKDYNSQGPYSNSYHKIDMTFDELSWMRTGSQITLQAALGTALGNGLFESYDYFDMEFYDNLQGMEYQHPLAELWSFGRLVNGNVFSVLAYANYIGMDAYMVRHQLMEFSKLGFVYFDFDKDEITLRDKLYDYIDASLMKRDYDVIRFVSRTTSGTENATLDLSTKDLVINGIPTIFLSDSQNVALVPENNQIIMKRNRNFQFDGIIDAGLFKFYGNNFFFEYDNFLVNLQNIDSLSISAKTGEFDSYGNAITTSLDNKIENITGELLIDAPFNKSGLMAFPEYPIFTSRENSYVYFDEPTIQEGVYDRDRFYFQLYPFSIDSLDNFRREAMKMEGTFISADILPPLEMEMSLRPDNSLGFYMTAPSDGIPIFNGKATFYNDLEMSSAGLHGYGSMDYIMSTTWSDDFLFHPDSMMTKSRKFQEKEKRSDVSFPRVENGATDIHYYPFKDVMDIDKMETAFGIFNDSTSFGGDLELRPSGLTGNGHLTFPDARFDSDQFSFWAQQIEADSAGVKLKKPLMDDFTFTTNDVRIDIDLDNREGDFIAREDYTLIEFPSNLYETRLNTVSWFMDRDEVMLTQTKYLPENQLDVGIDSLKANGPWYVSKHPKQDSLHFVAPLAYFNYSKKVLNAEKVPLIEVGDSYVFPHEGLVEVTDLAKMSTLKNAKILANSSSRYHLLHDANLLVDSRTHFRGSADYDYLDEFGNKYTFRMTQVEIDTSINTFGIGDVLPQDSLRISPYFDYKGEIRMSAQDEFLTFSGGVRLTHDCDVKKQWLKFENVINPDSVLIPVDAQMQNTDLNKIYAGTLKARDSIHIYPTFISGRKDYFDKNVTAADGFLFYNKAGRKYEIADSLKLNDIDSEGNYLALETDSCRLYSEGVLDPQLGFGRLKMNTVGEASHMIGDNSLNLKMMLGMDFLFHQEGLNMIANEIDSLIVDEPVDLTTRFYSVAMKNLVGTKEAERLETELGLYGAYAEISDSLDYTFLFNDFKLEWVQETRSYRHNGKIGIANIGDVQINKYVDAYVEFVERGSGDIFDIYLMIDKDNWFYMAYSPGGIQVLSSNAVFNELIFDLPTKERRIKGRGGMPSFIYSVAAERRVQLFLDRFLLYEEEKNAEE